MPEMSAIDASILDEAAQWLARRHASDFSEAEQAELARWRSLSATHEEIWQRIEQLKFRMDSVPRQLAWPFWIVHVLQEIAGRFCVHRHSLWQLQCLAGSPTAICHGTSGMRTSEQQQAKDAN
jgi:ferric-dicitrate binding protein FerR (iron transport regulator)